MDGDWASLSHKQNRNWRMIKAILLENSSFLAALLPKFGHPLSRRLGRRAETRNAKKKKNLSLRWNLGPLLSGFSDSQIFPTILSSEIWLGKYNAKHDVRAAKPQQAPSHMVLVAERISLLSPLGVYLQRRLDLLPGEPCETWI